MLYCVCVCTQCILGFLATKRGGGENKKNIWTPAHVWVHKLKQNKLLSWVIKTQSPAPMAIKFPTEAY